ncbi:MAG: radical SAM protein [Parcubacteria group bacterium]
MTDINFLITVPRFSKKGEYYSFPFGLAYISSYLKSKGFNIFCVNLCHYPENQTTKEILEQWIKEKNISVILTGGMSGHWDLIDDVINTAKKIKPEITTVAGGPLVTADPELAMDNMKLDYGIIGEGEITAGELAFALSQNKSIENIRGIIYRKENKLCCNNEQPPILDLDSLPFPDYESLGYDEWIELMKYSGQNPVLENYDVVRYSPIIGSRSCPFSCTFCYHPLGKVYRQRSLDNIFKEIDFLIDKYGSNFISFQDELFSVNHERMYECADRIKRYNIKWEAQFRVNNVTRDMLKRLKESNLHYMGFGVENISDKILKSMKKMITKAEIENAFKLAYEEKIFCSGNILLGDPEDTVETMDESIEWWKKHQHYNISLIFIKTIPDSPDYQYAIKNNIIKDKLKYVRNNFPIVNLTKIPDKQFNQIKKEVWGYRKSLKYVLDAELINSEKLPEKYSTNNYYSLTTACPACNHTDKYKAFMKTMTKYQTLNCKNCYARIKIEQKKAFYDEYNLFKMISNKYLQRFYVFLLKKEYVKPDNKFIIVIKKYTKKLLKKAD